MFTRLYLIIGIVVLVGGYFGIKIHSLNNTIEELHESYGKIIKDQNETISSLKNDIRGLNNELAITKVKEATEVANRNKLQSALDNVNSVLLEQELKNTKLVKEFEEYKKNREKKNKEVNSLVNKYKNKKLDCEAIIEFNKELSKVKYEDL